MGASGGAPRDSIDRRGFLKAGGLGLAGVMLFGASGCGGGNQGGRAKGGGTLKTSLDSDPPTLDPALAYDFVSWPLIHAMFLTPITYDASGKGFVPWAAKAVPKPENGGRRYVFDIRPGIKFVDGEPTDAAAFKYAIERIMDPKTKSPVTGFYTNIVGAKAYQKRPRGGIKGIKVLSRYRLQFDLEKPDQVFLQTMCVPSASAVPRKAVEKYGADFAGHVVANGPFKLGEWKRGARLVLEKNDDYKNPSGRPETTEARLDEIDFSIGVDLHVALLRVEQGSSQVAGGGIPSSDFAAVMNNPKWKDYIRHGTLNVLEYFYVNTQKKPWSDPRVRRALQYAIDKKRVVQVINGRATVADQILPPNMPGYDPSIKGYPYDPEKARSLLREAGFKKGTPLAFWTAKDPDGDRISQVIQQNLSDVGIDATIRNVSFSEYLSQTKAGKTDAGLANWYQDYPDPSDFLDILFNSDQIPANNYSRYSNPKVDRELERAQYMLDRRKRLALYQKIQRQILSDDPIVPLYYPVEYDFVSPKVGGFRVHPVWTGSLYAQWYLKRS